MSLIDTIRAKAKADVKRIALPEGDEPRTIKAAEILRAEGLAEESAHISRFCRPTTLDVMVPMGRVA